MDFTPPPGLDISESKRPLLFAIYSLTYALALVAVFLRLYCRMVASKAGLWWDDYLICIALCFVSGNYIDMTIWVSRGVGTHIYPLGLQGLYHFFVNLFVCEILYTLSICFIKYSILMFYWRIFGKTSMRAPIYIIAFIVTCWGLGVIFTTIFQCLPVRGFWDKTIEAKCGVDINKFFIGNAVPNIVTDWALLLLPLPYIWKLQRSPKQKAGVYAAFALGGLICIISIVRLIIMLQSYKVPSLDVTWVFIGPSMWTAVETNIGVLSACLPSLRALLKTGQSSTKQTYGKSYGSSVKSAGAYNELSYQGKHTVAEDVESQKGLRMSTFTATATADVRNQHWG